jgi:uncharacterized protein (DUF849 family)
LAAAEIVELGKAALAAGAGILHLDARDPCGGRASSPGPHYGLEDSLNLGHGWFARNSAEQVATAGGVSESGWEVATPNVARQMLDLKGRDAVRV